MEKLPITRFFQICVGMIGISISEFWDLSLIEIYNAIEGFKEFNSTEANIDPLTKTELTELMELYPD